MWITELDHFYRKTIKTKIKKRTYVGFGVKTFLYHRPSNLPSSLPTKVTLIELQNVDTCKTHDRSQNFEVVDMNAVEHMYINSCRRRVPHTKIR